MRRRERRVVGFYFGCEIALLHPNALAGIDQMDELGYLGESGESEEEANRLEHTPVDDTHGRTKETTDKEQNAEPKGNVESFHNSCTNNALHYD
ncbi:MAG: hypothetical protein Q4B58_02720 [Bacteroidales bacterium]|nr:hypothetical protein [Bacteroidales bacterium]